jgi:hypothetical protein
MSYDHAWYWCLEHWVLEASTPLCVLGWVCLAAFFVMTLSDHSVFLIATSTFTTTYVEWSFPSQPLASSPVKRA